MLEFYKKNKNDINKIFYFLIFIILIYFFTIFLASYIAPLIFGYILCLLLYPITEFFQNKCHISRNISSLVSIALFLFVIVFVCTNIIIKIIYEAKLFSVDFPVYVENALNLIKEFKEKFNTYFKIMPTSMQEAVNNLCQSYIRGLSSTVGTGVKDSSVGIVKGLPKFIMIVILGFISTFFFLNDKYEIEEFIKRQIPLALKRRITVIKTGVINSIIGYVKAQSMLMCIVAIICIIGLSIIKYPYALFLGIIISIIDALPVFGSGAVFWPWCAYSFFTGNYKNAICIIIINLTVLLTRQILEPRILGKQIGLHPLATLTSIYAGLRIFGLFGFILGPMVLVTFKAMQDSELLPRWR